jgi:hypothetical protein
MEMYLTLECKQCGRPLGGRWHVVAGGTIVVGLCMPCSQRVEQWAYDSGWRNALSGTGQSPESEVGTDETE